MADYVIYTQEAARVTLTAIGKMIADSAATPSAKVGKLRLFDDTLVLTANTTRVDLIAAETTLTGYPVGGYDITDFFAPLNAPLGGSVITSNLVEVAYASGPNVVIGGYWVEDTDTPTPNVRYAQYYDPKRPLAAVGDGWPIAVQMGYGANS